MAGHGDKPSNRHPLLLAIGGGSLLGGIVGSLVWGVVMLAAGEVSWWVIGPVAVGMLAFVGTALLAATIDQARKDTPRT